MRCSIVFFIFFMVMPALVKAERYKTGDVYDCARIPAFVSKLGMQQPVAIDTSLTQYPGLVLRELRGQQRLFQHSGWKITGQVGSTVRDAQGNIYLIPVPIVSLATNPLERRNIVYKVDSQTGVMTEFVELPIPIELSQGNPFGTMGITLDCQTASLYVSSVAGSSPAKINGTIYRIDLANGKIADSYSGVDAIGIAVFNLPNEKRLYFGDARSSSLFSVKLKSTGDFIIGSKPRHELSLLTVKNGDSTQIRKIHFPRTNQGNHIMSLEETEFSYRLIAELHARQKKYNFELQEKTQEWKFLSLEWGN